MNSFETLIAKVEEELARPDNGSDRRGAGVICGDLRTDILNAIGNLLQAARWSQLPQSDRQAILSRALLNDPGLTLQVREAYELDAAIRKFANDMVEAGNPAVSKMLKDHGVPDPKDSKRVAEWIRGDRALMAELAQKSGVGVPCPLVMALELDEIRSSRGMRDPTGGGPHSRGRDPAPGNASTGKPDFLGLALSGGGIRSATFNLGILQGLADLNLLHKVDYLSTVSGGGYIGGWLAAWCKRTSPSGIGAVQTAVSPRHTPNPAGEDQAPIRFLREYSNYLTPKAGFFTADTWTLVTEWVRNTLLNQTVLVLFLAGILLLPHGLIRFLFSGSVWLPEAFVVLTIVAFIGAIVIVARNMAWFPAPPPRAGDEPAEEASPDARRRATSRWYVQPFWIQLTIVLPAILAAFAFTMSHVAGILGHPVSLPDLGFLDVLPEPRLLISGAVSKMTPVALPAHTAVDTAGTVASILFVSLLAVSLGGRFDRCFYDGRSGATGPARARAIGGIALSALLASLVGGMLTILFSRLWVVNVSEDVAAQLTTSLGQAAVSAVQSVPAAAASLKWTPNELKHLVAAFVFGPPLLLQVFALTVTTHVGLLGRNLPDERREWWSRLGAWVLIYCLAWVLVCGISLYGPRVPGELGRVRYWVAAAGGAGWLITTIFGVLSAQSAQTGSTEHDTGWRARVMNGLAVAAPYVFVLGLLMLISYVLHKSLGDASGALGKIPPDAHVWRAWIWAGVLLAMAFLLAWRIDVNEFSMHHFYKNRLVRAYLGASRLKTRAANPFTGFDPEDEVKLATLRVKSGWRRDTPYVGPYPIINAALNLVGGSNLAWQERKAESFVFTPQFCGYAYSPPDDRDATSRQRCTVESYRPTQRYGYGKEGGIGIGTSLAISGAAASPNMGYHSSPPVSFLMTMFNVRLGWWLGNPRRRRWEKSSPRVGLNYLLKELLGTTTNVSSYVNLSDGGHFENLGIYELVRRRCSYIIACDAAQDPDSTFADLGNAIRKCRTDFGVEIDLPLDRMRQLAESDIAKAHGTVGTIHYPTGAKGRLLYIKTTLTRDESVDLLEYSIRESAFPNQSTADQWFDESQFESYRKLGHHSIHATLNTVVERWKRPEGLYALFQDLRSLWFPPTPAISRSARKHAEAYDALLERVRQIGIQDLDTVLFPTAHLAPGRNGSGIRRTVNRSTRSKKSGVPRDLFYVVNSLIQLMETVFLDLNMDEEGNHPHNEGWVNIFKRWAESPVLQTVWEDSRDTYGDRFQRFCEKTLGLESNARVTS